MKVKDLLKYLRQGCGGRVEIRENNFYICETRTDSKGLEPYYEREIIDWFVDINPLVRTYKLVIDLKETVKAGSSQEAAYES